MYTAQSDLPIISFQHKHIWEKANDGILVGSLIKIPAICGYLKKKSPTLMTKNVTLCFYKVILYSWQAQPPCKSGILWESKHFFQLFNLHWKAIALKEPLLFKFQISAWLNTILPWQVRKQKCPNSHIHSGAKHNYIILGSWVYSSEGAWYGISFK